MQLALISIIGLTSYTGIKSQSASSADFILDYGGVTTGAQKLISTDYIVHGGLIPIEAAHEKSSTFQIETINFFPDSTPEPNLCGNGIIDSGEQCDGSNFATLACNDFGFNRGTLTCTSTCTISTINCSKSGSGYVLDLSTPTPSPSPSLTPLPTATPSLSPSPQTPLPTFIPTPEPQLSPEPSTLPFVETRPVAAVINSIPSLSPLPTPTPDPEPEVGDKHNFHLYTYAEREGVYTIDHHPLVADKFLPNTNYTLIISSASGNEIHEENLTTDKNGVFVYESPAYLLSGDYTFSVYDQFSRLMNQYNFYIQDIPYPELKITEFSENKNIINDFDYTIYLGEYKHGGDHKIVGRAVPSAQVYAYFKSNVVALNTYADQNGNFSFDVPKSLDLGRHEVKILQIYADRTISKNLKYAFDLIDGENNPFIVQVCNFLPIILGYSLVLINLVLLLIEAFQTSYKNSKKIKRNVRSSKKKN